MPYTYEYTLTDHLGNNRVTFDQTNGKVGEEATFGGYGIVKQNVALGKVVLSGDQKTAGNIIGNAGANVTTAAALGAAGKGISAVRGAGEIGVANPVPSTVARVVPTEFVSGNLGKASVTDVFVTAASDIKGMTAAQIAERLTIQPSSSGYTIYEFPTPTGISTPINRLDPGFIGGGKTAGGAREFAIPNQVIPKNATIRTVQP